MKSLALNYLGAKIIGGVSSGGNWLTKALRSGIQGGIINKINSESFSRGFKFAAIGSAALSGAAWLGNKIFRGLNSLCIACAEGDGLNDSNTQTAEPVGRHLTLGERSMVLDSNPNISNEALDNTLIYDGANPSLNTGDRPNAPNGNIFYPDGQSSHEAYQYHDDFSANSVPLASKKTFIHEMFHVHQVRDLNQNLTYRTAITVFKNFTNIFSSTKRLVPYNYDLGSAKNFVSLNLEQQADIIADRWLKAYGNGETSRTLRFTVRQYDSFLSTFSFNPGF